MANSRLPMFQLRRILQLRQQGFSQRRIASALAISRTTVEHYLRIVEAHFSDLAQALSWQDDQLHRLFTHRVPQPEADRLGDLYQRFENYEAQLAKPGVTRHHLWLAYKQANPNAIQYSQFCERYRTWRLNQQTVMHLEHKAGETLFVDYAGKKLALVDPTTGQPQPVELFVAVLACSQLTFAKAVASQRKADFLQALSDALTYFGGVPEAIVPDNLKAAVTKANRYEPDLNESIEDFAAHYSTCIYPARSGKPRDKALVEKTISILYSRVYVPLQEQSFHSLKELNQAIAQQVEVHNRQCFQGKPYSRRQRFETLEEATLMPLPLQPYRSKAFRMAKVHPNCHVLLGEDKHYYSVPYRHVGQSVKLVYTAQTVEIYHDHQRIALHERQPEAYQYTTRREHLPSQQQWLSQWSAEYFIDQASQIGPHTRLAIQELLHTRSYPQQAFRSCAGVLSLVAKVGQQRLEGACERALTYGAVSYKLIRSILERNLDKTTSTEVTHKPLPTHENIRGADVYQ
ncbi:IS21 family transposase [Spirosoma sp. KUDC1026]|nr:IS21 family transposase [Spirosoma sp. KUDC1026]QKZ13450.1 IS21 family transposase [Spirosoma sp. KUDC1026]QKZ14085.1 IS21 family transposase [Spirosoma sp. KUDC1026]QKZ14338.1 IS21 family transposase [Spirosoma sp. KUDC1026]QKZ14941.1 IS21 family transposase [Spirosoma sp. KUDC1026]